MQDIQYLHSIGADPKSLKNKLTSDKMSQKLKDLINVHEMRITRSISRNMTDSRMFWTLDRVIDSPIHNMSYVQAREIISQGTDPQKLVDQFVSFGLQNMLTPLTDQNGAPVLVPGKGQMYKLDMPIFDRIFVPLVLAYRTFRWAKIFTDRNISPLYPYTPQVSTLKNVSKAQVITSVIGKMSEDMGYREDLKQVVLQMLDYGSCLKFVKEAWHREEYDTKSNGKVQTKTQREGLRFTIPRPERTFFDGASPLSTLNTDTGVNFCGYWDIVRYSEIKSNKAYWNTDKVNIGGQPSLFAGAGWSVYSELFPCTIKFPTCNLNSYDSLDRLNKEFWYTNADPDSAVTIVVMFDKVIPKDHDLFPYDKPVWMRFVYADTCTPLFAEVLPYCPAMAYIYDYDSNRAVINSMTMQLTPFQQMVGNYLTQYAISVRNNLPRVVFFNTDVVDKESIDIVRNEKHRLLQELVWIPYSKRQLTMQQAQQAEAFHPVIFPQVNTNELTTSITVTLQLLERILGFPAQEAGQAASHEQTARETLIIATNSGIRIAFTGSGVDAGEAATKRATYEAWINYGSDTVTAQVINVSPERKKALEDMGFEVEQGESNKQNTYGVKGPKAALTLDSFASSESGPDQIREAKIAIAMMQMLSVMLQNPAIIQAVGMPQLIALFNEVLIYAGMPSDFTLQVKPSETPEGLVKVIEEAKGQILGQVAEQMKQGLSAVADGVRQQVVEPVGQQLQAAAEQVQVLQQDAQQRDALLQRIIEIIQPNATSQPPGIVPAGIPAPPVNAPVGVGGF